MTGCSPRNVTVAMWGRAFAAQCEGWGSDASTDLLTMTKAASSRNHLISEEPKG
jgi:hypothetical protein